MDGKTDTFVLDFRNDTSDIEKAFAPWYERTEAIPTDPNLLWDTHRALMDSPVIHEDEIGSPSANCWLASEMTTTRRCTRVSTRHSRDSSRLTEKTKTIPRAGRPLRFDLRLHCADRQIH